jgi:hypothetical protein
MSFLLVSLVALQSAAEVRQIVSFRFLPGKLWEKEHRVAAGSESGRFLLADGFDFFRILGNSSLADWQRYVEAERGASFAHELEGWIAESRQVILAPVRELSVR